MYILAIETTGATGSVALLENIEKDRVHITQKKLDGQMSHLEQLVPNIGVLLQFEGVEKSEITHIAVSVGPGSFTGIRIGVSTARALAQSLGLEKALSVPTLQSFLYKREAARAKDAGKVCCAIINARRGQVYGMVDGYLEDGPYMLTDVLDVIKDKVYADGKTVIFFGDGIDAYEDTIRKTLEGLGEYEFAAEKCRYQEAYAVADYAFTNLEKCSVSLEDLLPDYMRKAEAEQKLEAGELPICKGPKQE